MGFLRGKGEHAQSDEEMAEDDCKEESQEDKEDVEGLGGGGGEVRGGCEGEVCRGLLVGNEEGGVKENVQIVRTTTRTHPEIRLPITFLLILGFLIPGKHRRRVSFSVFLGFCHARRCREKSTARAGC